MKLFQKNLIALLLISVSTNYAAQILLRHSTPLLCRLPYLTNYTRYLDPGLAQSMKMVPATNQSTMGILGSLFIFLGSVPPIYKACAKGDLETIKNEISKDPKIIDRKSAMGTYKGDTLLIIAAKNGYLEIVKFLLECGANHTIKNQTGDTAFFAAIKNGQKEIMCYLLDQKLQNIEERDSEGNTPLIYAASWQKKELVLELLKRNADTSSANYSRLTAWHYAAPNFDGTAEMIYMHQLKQTEEYYKKNVSAPSHEKQVITPVLISSSEQPKESTKK